MRFGITITKGEMTETFTYTNEQLYNLTEFYLIVLDGRKFLIVQNFEKENIIISTNDIFKVFETK